MSSFIWQMLGLAAAGLVLVIITIISLTRRYGLTSGGYLVPTKMVLALLIVGIATITCSCVSLAIFNHQRATTNSVVSSSMLFHPGPQVFMTAGPCFILHLAWCRAFVKKLTY